MPTRPHATVLVHHPDGVEAYADLIRAPRGRVTLRVAADHDAVRKHARDCDVFYVWKPPVDAYARAPRLAWLQAMGAGVDWALVPELPPGVTVTRAPGIFGAWMAEYVAAWCLHVTQRIAEYSRAQRERRWIEQTLPDRLRGKTVCVVGLGDIGRAVARALRGLGARIVGVSRSGRAVREAERVYPHRALTRAVAAADFVVLVLPLTPHTMRLVDARVLAAMKPTAWLVNIARGAVVDEAALLAALGERRIAGAVLDVFAREPLAPEHPFWTMDNVVVTPHISGPSTAEEITPVFNANLARWLAGRPLRHVVDRRRGY
ncbi:MAG: D-2-hydroxyacid dehydrogenase [Candidatus Rokubacteria bacterium]|nr:D-2-hydroxyacid dehydrogenase [Candidatus Rokubacteria bacterium]MBI3824427.1 D-2-hydroxyacid dehydrogenase [Candidatus Rokubacteria bacterium]